VRQVAPLSVDSAGVSTFGEDPRGDLDLLRRFSPGFHRAGQALIRGVPTRAYRGVIYVPAMPDSGRETATVWIDRQGLVRRLKEESGGGYDVRDYDDFGVPVQVTAPPANAVGRARCH
jgi:hypothetical protein